MTLQDYQDAVDSWIKQYGVRYFDEMTNMVLLMEELGELARLMSRKYGEQSFKSPEQSKHVEEDIKDEIADIFFVLTCLSNQMNIDITESLKANLEKKTIRDKQRHRSNEKL